MARLSKNEMQLAKTQWDRYRSVLTRGHAEFQKRAQENENFYLGMGLQWSEEARQILEDQDKPVLEIDMIFSIVNTVAGYQTQSRLDLAFKPRETGDQDLSDVLTKISMHILDENHFPWVESEVFRDGIIQSRGFFDVRLEFDENMYGNIKITSRDPLDILPDPDAKSYNPDEWQDIMETKWMTITDIEDLYGKAGAKKVKRYMPDDQDFGEGEIGATRNKFAGREHLSGSSWTWDDTGEPHARLIERQWWKLQMREHYMDMNTGDLRLVPDDISTKEKNAFAKANEFEIVKKLSKRVRWTVSTEDVVLHDDWSPYDHFTIIPYFPYFRRGVTLGLVDNLKSPQELLNKVISQTLHVINTTANSGWQIEENSLTNMDTEDLEEVGGQTGLVIEYKAGREKPEKIMPNQIPTGLTDMYSRATGLITTISGVSDAFQGQQGNEITGVAIQSRVQQNAVQLASPMDNLYRSRHMLAERILELVQNFYTEQRMITVTSTDPTTGEQEQEQVVLNEPVYEDDIVKYLNDTTQGKYDLVISDVPDQVTFQNAQFAQALEMRKFGIAIPDDVMITLSGISNKNEIAKRMAAQTPEQAQAEARQADLEASKLEADIEETQGKTANQKADGIKKAIEAAAILAENPNIGPAAQILMDEAGLGEEEEGPQPGQDVSPEEQQEMIAMQQQAAMGGAQ